MAAPHVAGVAALLRASGVHDPDTLEALLKRTAKEKRDRRRYAAGLVQADRALAGARRDLGGLRGLLAAGLGLLVLFGVRRRGRLQLSLVQATVASGVIAGALAWLPWALPGALGSLAAGIPTVLVDAGGAYLAPFLSSALIPLAVAALLLGVRRAGPVVFGTAIAFSAWMFLEAILPTKEFGLLPAWSVGPWLLLNACIALVLARLTATRPRGA